MKTENNYVIVLPDESEESTSAGIQLPDVEQNNVAIWTGKVVSKGNYENKKVAYSKIMAQNWQRDMKEYAVIREKDIICVL